MDSLGDGAPMMTAQTSKECPHLLHIFPHHIKLNIGSGWWLRADWQNGTCGWVVGVLSSRICIKWQVGDQETTQLLPTAQGGRLISILHKVGLARRLLCRLYF